MEVAPRNRVRSALAILLLITGATIFFLATKGDAQGQMMNDPARESLFGPPRGTGYGPARPNAMRPPRTQKQQPPKRQTADIFDNDPLRPGEYKVVEVRIVGNEAMTKDRIQSYIHTRVDRPFRMSTIEADVRRLYETGKFVTVEPLYEDRPGGRVVIFKVAERPTLREVKFIRQEKLSFFDSLFSSVKRDEEKLRKKAGLEPGAPADPFRVEEARKAIEDYYREKGFARVRVSIAEGNKPTDRRAVFVIHEGPKEKIVWTKFTGNTIATDARLLTQVESKQGPLWIFKGEFDREKLKADEEKLTAYYRSLGFFHARVGHDVTFTRFPFPWSEPKAVVNFVIDEGLRWKVRNVSFIGNTKISTTELQEALELEKGEFFNQHAMVGDVRRIREQYGGVGHVFCDVKAEPRFLEEPGQLDLVYNVDEGDRYRVGRILPKIGGDNPHTKWTTLLNPLSQVPGDIIDTRKIRETETRYMASQVFNTDRQKGKMPKIVFSPTEAKKIADEESREQVARQPRSPAPGFRGQSPDNVQPTPRLARRPYPSHYRPAPRQEVTRPVPRPTTRGFTFFDEPNFELRPYRQHGGTP